MAVRSLKFRYLHYSDNHILRALNVETTGSKFNFSADARSRKAFNEILQCLEIRYGDGLQHASVLKGLGLIMELKDNVETNSFELNTFMVREVLPLVLMHFLADRKPSLPQSELAHFGTEKSLIQKYCIKVISEICRNNLDITQALVEDGELILHLFYILRFWEISRQALQLLIYLLTNSKSNRRMFDLERIKDFSGTIKAVKHDEFPILCQVLGHCVQISPGRNSCEQKWNQSRFNSLHEKNEILLENERNHVREWPFFSFSFFNSNILLYYVSSPYLAGNSIFWLLAKNS